MNLVNKILILVILILLINHLTEGKIIETINRYFSTCKNNVENFIGLTYAQKCIKPNALPKTFYMSNNLFLIYKMVQASLDWKRVRFRS